MSNGVVQQSIQPFVSLSSHFYMERVNGFETLNIFKTQYHYDTYLTSVFCIRFVDEMHMKEPAKYGCTAYHYPVSYGIHKTWC